MSEIGQLRITFGLFFKASPGSHPFIWKLGFIHMKMKTSFYMKRWAPGLALKKRPKVIWKWPIILDITKRYFYCEDYKASKITPIRTERWVLTRRPGKPEYPRKKSSEQNRELSQVNPHRVRERTWRDTLMKTSLGYYRNIKAGVSRVKPLVNFLHVVEVAGLSPVRQTYSFSNKTT